MIKVVITKCFPKFGFLIYGCYLEISWSQNKEHEELLLLSELAK